MKLMDL
jgi:hypothetical protein